MKDKLSNLPLHPFFVAVYPILFLLSINISQIQPSQALRPILISLFAATLMTVLLGVATRDFRQGGLSASIILALFFSYGHFHQWLETQAPALAGHVFLGSVWLILLVLGLTLKYRISNIGSVTKYLNLIVAALLIQPILNIGIFLSRSSIPEAIAPPSPLENLKPNTNADQDLPDIYYIIPDGYGRTDVIREIYGYDNSAFIQFLEERGFYVAKQSHSNYIQTALSLSSSLNLDYLGNVAGVQSGDREPLAEMIRHSKLRTFLEEQGYQIVTYQTAYNPTTISDADIFITYQVRYLNDLEGLVFSTSALRAAGDYSELDILPFICDTHRGGILHMFETLKKIPELAGPKFVFVHLPVPHPPFIFGADGEPVQYGECSGRDGSLFHGTFEDYQTGYPLQMEYLSQLMEEAVDTILTKSENPPVIIIQGDHGPGMLLDWDSIEDSCLRERTAILNAFYIPGEHYDRLYETISPVNSFRYVLNTVFGLELPLLEDRIYFSGWDTPYQLADITQEIEPACPLPK